MKIRISRKRQILCFFAVTLVYGIGVLVRIQAYEAYQQEVLMEYYRRMGVWLEGYLDFPPFWSSQYSYGIDFFFIIGLGTFWLRVVLSTIADFLKNSKVWDSTQRLGRTLTDGAKFAFSGLIEAAKEGVESRGVPTSKSYWKEHSVDAALTTVSALVGVPTLACDIYVLTDPSVQRSLKYWEVPEGTSFIPPNRPSAKYSEPTIVTQRSLNAWEYVSLIVPAVLAANFIRGAVKYGIYKHRSKKSSQKE